MESKPNRHELTTTHSLDQDQPQHAECSTIAAAAAAARAANNTAIPLPFLPLYSQYSFAQRLKSTIPFSKLLFSNNIKPLCQAKMSADQPAILHDTEQCMFLMRLDDQGRAGSAETESKRVQGFALSNTGSVAAICYLPTRVKNVIEVYHTVGCVLPSAANAN